MRSWAGIRPRTPSSQSLPLTASSASLILAWEKQLGIRSYYWGRQSIGDRVTFFTIKYSLGPGCDLRRTEAAKFRGAARIEYWKPQSAEAFESEVWDLLPWLMSIAGVCSTYLLPSVLHFATQEKRRKGFLCRVVMIPLFILTSSKLFVELIEGARLSIWDAFLFCLLLHSCTFGMYVEIEKMDADMFSLLFHLGIAGYLQTELKWKATRV